MKERDMQVQFGAWLRQFGFDSSAVFELKICNGKSIAFDSVKGHQVDALVAAKEGGLYHKITDLPLRAFKEGGFKMMRFGKPKPFDCFFVKKVKAYVVLMFYEPRKKKEALLIDITTWLSEQNESKRKSLTKDRAVEIADRIINL